LIQRKRRKRRGEEEKKKEKRSRREKKKEKRKKEKRKGLSLASKIPSQKARWRLGRSQKGLRGDRREARGISGDLGEVGEELEGLGEDWKVFEGRKDFAAEVVLERVGGQTPRKSGERKKNLKEPRAIMKSPQESEQWKDSQSNFFLFLFFFFSFLFLSFFFFPSLPTSFHLL